MDAGYGTGMSNAFSRIREGMKVFDRSGKELGEVEQVFLGAAGDTTTTGFDPVGPVSDLGSEVAGDNLDPIDDKFPELFRSGTDVSGRGGEVVRNRMRREGFLKLDSHGLFTGDRYILPDQVESVVEDGVRLNVDFDSLIG